jgi:hypothetical protein
MIGPERGLGRSMRSSSRPIRSCSAISVCHDGNVVLLIPRLVKVMTRLFSSTWVIAFSFLVQPALAVTDAPDAQPAARGEFPLGRSGRPLNLGFETGTLADWTAVGTAFQGQPIEGDTVSRRRGDMHSGHAGRYWVGSYERTGDAAQGTLTSVPFRVSKPFASFLVGGGSLAGTSVEIVANDTGQVISRTFGDDKEDLERATVDLSSQVGREVYIRLVDRETVGWGHINFDDFRLHDTKPDVPPRRRPSTPRSLRSRGPRARTGGRGHDGASRIQGDAFRGRARCRSANRSGD